MIHRIFETDAYEMLARGIPRDEPIVALDVGAHTGKIATRIRGVFQAAVVYAFEPAAGPFAELARRAEADTCISPIRAAVGDRDGEIVLHETRSPYLTSVLEPTSRTRTGSFGAAEVVCETRVSVVRLDTWASESGVESIDLMKLDVQGYELPALRGAGELLDRTRAVYAEAHLEPAYEGASTFSEIDLFLRERGFVLHQIHDLMTRGEDLQTLQLDALWVRQDLLEAIRQSPLERATPPWATAMLGAFERCARMGLERVALFGAGTHTRSVEPWLDSRDGVRVVAIIDDSPAILGETAAGRSLISVDEIKAHGVEAIILSSDSYEDELWRRTAGLRREGVPVLRLYGREIESMDMPGEPG